MATATTTDTYLQQIHTARTQLHECFRRAHELLAEREAHLLRELETIQNDYETEINSQQEELQGIKASQQFLKNNLRDNDLLNKALADINRKMDEILKLSSGTHRIIRFQWNIDFERDLQQAGEIIANTVLKPTNLPPVIPQSADMTPVILQSADMTPVIPQSADMTPVIPQSANMTPVIPQPTNLPPIIPQPDNLSPVITRHFILDYKNKSIPIISCCKHKQGKSTAPGEFYWPAGLAIEPKSRRIYIADKCNDRVQVFSPDGEYVFMFSRNMNWPHGICINKDTVYVSLRRDHCITSYKLDGVYVNKVGSEGAMNGQFNMPTGLAVSPTTRHLYVCDYNNHRVQIFNQKLKFHHMFGNNKIHYPRDVKLSQYLVIVLDEGDPCLHLFNIDNQTLLRSVISRGDNKQTIEPIFFTADRELNILLTDYIKHCVCVFSQSGELITQFGKEGHSTGEFIRPAGIAINNPKRIVVVSENTNNALQFFC